MRAIAVVIMYYNISMGIAWARSADRHGVEHSDAVHAIVNHEYWVREFDEPRVEGGKRPDLFIGPTRDGAETLEVMAEVTPPSDMFVFHVMHARQKMVERAERMSR